MSVADPSKLSGLGVSFGDIVHALEANNEPWRQR
jgi:hypothetical protein